MAFFNEFPHTHTYDSDISWLITRMKDVLLRMNTVEDRMTALEKLISDFINQANIPKVVADYINTLLNDGTMLRLIFEGFNDYNSQPERTYNFLEQNVGTFSGANTDVSIWRVDNMLFANLNQSTLLVTGRINSTTNNFYLPRQQIEEDFNIKFNNNSSSTKIFSAVVVGRGFADTTDTQTKTFGIFSGRATDTDLYITLPVSRLSSAETQRYCRYDYRPTIILPPIISVV